MSEQVKVSLYQQQKAVKPLVEDIIPEILDGDMKKNALDFVTHIRENKIKPAWVLTNQWKANYKGRCICKIILKQDCWTSNDSWIVAAWLENINEYEDIIINENLQDLVWDNVYYCVHKPAGSPSGAKIQHALKYPCNLWNCAPGKNIMLCGKELTNICRNSNRQYFWFHDPSQSDLDGIKRLLELEQKAREKAKQ